MAQTAAAGTGKFVHGNRQFPVLFENSEIRVYKNPSDEVFVEDVRTGANMRIGLYRGPKGGLVFTTSEHVGPILVSNMIGWRVGQA